jgi:hypothetical protein
MCHKHVRESNECAHSCPQAQALMKIPAVVAISAARRSDTTHKHMDGKLVPITHMQEGGEGGQQDPNNNNTHESTTMIVAIQLTYLNLMKDMSTMGNRENIAKPSE